MRALILAAGRGSRLEGAHAGSPKGLIEVHGKPILDRQIEILENAGIQRICLATGYAFTLLERRYGQRVDYRYNPFFAETNNMVSFLFARDWAVGDLVVLYADLLYEPRILEAAMSSTADISLVVDRHALEPGHALVSISGGLISRIDSQLEPTQADARFIGIGRFSSQGLADMLPELENAAKDGSINSYYYVGVQRLIGRGYRVEPIDISGLKWMEVDYPQDLERARSEWI